MKANKVTIGNATLYCGDCRNLLGVTGKSDALITDPVWPSNSVDEFAEFNAESLFFQMLVAAACCETKREA